MSQIKVINPFKKRFSTIKNCMNDGLFVGKVVVEIPRANPHRLGDVARGDIGAPLFVKEF